MFSRCIDPFTNQAISQVLNLTRFYFCELSSPIPAKTPAPGLNETLKLHFKVHGERKLPEFNYTRQCSRPNKNSNLTYGAGDLTYRIKVDSQPEFKQLFPPRPPSLTLPSAEMLPLPDFLEFVPSTKQIIFYPERADDDIRQAQQSEGYYSSAHQIFVVATSRLGSNYSYNFSLTFYNSQPTLTATIPDQQIHVLQPLNLYIGDSFYQDSDGYHDEISVSCEIESAAGSGWI